MVVVGDARGEAEAIVLFADAFIVAAAQEHIDRFRVRIGAVEVAQLIEGEAERVSLSVRVVLEFRAVRRKR